MPDVLEIVVAPIELPIGRVARAEIVVNGTALIDIVNRAEGGSGYAPLVPEEVLPRLRDALTSDQRPTRVHAIGCSCGDDRCSWVQILVDSRPETVRWDGVRTSRLEHLPLGPFVFDRLQYEHAIAHPRESATPVRHYEA